VVTGLAAEGSRVLQGFTTDTTGRDVDAQTAVEAGGVIIAWCRAVSAAALRRLEGRIPSQGRGGVWYGVR
jgi:hypothetical protein